MPRPSVYPFGWPRLPRIPNLEDHLGERERHLRSAVNVVEDEVHRESARLEEVKADLFARFRLDPLSLGETALDEHVGRARVSTTDPRRLAPNQLSASFTVDVHTAVIPVLGDQTLLALWPPNVQAPEPSERIHHDPLANAIRIPAYQELDDADGSRTRRHLREQDELIRRLVDATNARVATWNSGLPGLIDRQLAESASRAESRSTVRSGLGYPVALAQAHPIIYRLPRPESPRPKPRRLEHGDYPLLDDDDFIAVLAVVRRWADFVPEHPSVVIGKDEEALRDELLHDLNTRWSATGETFSKLGKTDIRVVLDPASTTGVSDVVFKAECKVWDDAGAVSDAFVQLAERYLTSREVRTALIMFIPRRSDFVSARERAIARIVGRHGGTLLEKEIAGWPVLEVPHPQQPEVRLLVAVALIDTSAPTAV